MSIEQTLSWIGEILIDVNKMTPLVQKKNWKGCIKKLDSIQNKIDKERKVLKLLADKSYGEK